jgi:hypothetical protein
MNDKTEPRRAETANIETRVEPGVGSSDLLSGERIVKQSDGREYGYVLSDENVNGLPMVFMLPVEEIRERLRNSTLRGAAPFPSNPHHHTDSSCSADR